MGPMSNIFYNLAEKTGESDEKLATIQSEAKTRQKTP
jgi:hypothetical protein